MKTWLLAFALVTTLAVASSCAKPDWIQDTLVTVDVTGEWEGEQTWQGQSNPVRLVLKQDGAKVTGILEGIRNRAATQESPISIVGTVSGDTFSFSEVSDHARGTPGEWR